MRKFILFVLSKKKKKIIKHPFFFFLLFSVHICESKKFKTVMWFTKVVKYCDRIGLSLVISKKACETGIFSFSLSSASSPCPQPKPTSASSSFKGGSREKHARYYFFKLISRSIYFLKKVDLEDILIYFFFTCHCINFSDELNRKE